MELFSVIKELKNLRKKFNENPTAKYQREICSYIKRIYGDLILSKLSESYYPKQISIAT